MWWHFFCSCSYLLLATLALPKIMGKYLFEICKQCLVLTVKTPHGLCIDTTHLNSRQWLWTGSLPAW